MLKLTAPIKTVLNNDLIEGGESFAKRIMANYGQMTEFITREDLFHVVTQPPEIFLMDGGGSSFLSETEIHNNQLKKVEIINNLMNRILVSADGHLTYQDEVYITNVLHKLGIRDEKTFMSRVYELTEETKNNNQLIETYWNNLNELRQMISVYRMQSDEQTTQETTENFEEVLHLHEDVFHRWMTGALYRIQNNFRTSVEGSTTIEGDAYRMTEEQRLSQQILLIRLRETVRGESLPLVYRHDNYYEVPTDEDILSSGEMIAEQIASAVLLQIVDNLYENISSKNLFVEDRFYHTENAFYGAADHVFERMEGNTSYLISLKREGDVTQMITEQTRTEMNAITDIIDHYYDTDVTNMALYELESVTAEMTHPAGAEAPAEAEESRSGEIHVDERNSLEQQLYQINIQNEQRHRQYIRNLSQMAQERARVLPGRPGDDERIRQAQFAFQHPEEFKEQIAETQGQQEEALEVVSQNFIERLPVETKEVFKVIEAYIKEPQKVAEQYRIYPGGEVLLYRDSILNHRTERLLKENERIAEVIEADHVANRRTIERMQTVEETVGRITPETVNLVHKVNDVTVDEETIENLRQQINRIENDTRKQNDVVENRETVTTRQVNNVHETVITQRDQEQIARMIQENISGQIGTITGKVYSRIERQLMSERRRRGM